MDKIHMLYGCIISTNEKDKIYVYTVNEIEYEDELH